MEIQFICENFTEKDPKSLMDHIQSMASGEAPFFATTLSLVYYKLVQKIFSKRAPLGSGLGGQTIATPTPSLQESTSTSSVILSSNWQAPAPVTEPVTSDTVIKWVGLKCARCFNVASIHNLRDDLYCPQCPDTGRNGRGEKGWPFMRCMGCNDLRELRIGGCVKAKCRGVFT